MEIHFNSWVIELALVLTSLAVGLKSIDYARNTMKRRAKRRLVQDRVLSVIDTKSDGLFSKLSDAVFQGNMIDLPMMTRVTDDLKRASSGSVQTIRIVVHTCGGMATAAESIANAIVRARAQGITVEAYVPYYAFSGGCLIALACDKIFMLPNSIIGPTDGQMSSGKSTHSVRAICETVEWQKENAPKKIDAKWYASYVDAQSCKTRQREFVNKLIAAEIYSQEDGDKIYEELFSGKYNHDQGFDATWAMEHRLPVELIDDMPSFVSDALSTFKAKPDAE